MNHSQMVRESPAVEGVGGLLIAGLVGDKAAVMVCHVTYVWLCFDQRHLTMLQVVDAKAAEVAAAAGAAADAQKKVCV